MILKGDDDHFTKFLPNNYNILTVHVIYKLGSNEVLTTPSVLQEAIAPKAAADASPMTPRKEL